MARDSRIITIENTRFIFMTNFSGDPERDNFGSKERKANIIIPTEEQAMDLKDAGFNVKWTKPKEGEEEGFVPTYFVSIKANYDSEWPPKIYLVCGDADPEELTEKTIKRLDNIYILNVNVVLNPYYSQRNDSWSLYIKTMYVEQDETEDPFAKKYFRNRRGEEDE